MFVSVRHRKGLPAAGLPVLVLEHLGDSAASAISIPPGLEVPVPFPSGQRLGDDDTAWFRVEPRAALVAGPRTEQVCLTPPDGRDAEVTVLDSALAPLGPSAAGSGVLTVDVPVFDDDTFYAQVTRDGDDAVGHTIRWETPLTYLRLSEGFVVHVADETSADWPGADEPELRITIDGDPVALLETTWDDADTGEDWPGLTEGLLSAARQRGWLQPSIAFVDALGLSLEEPDPPLGLAPRRHRPLDQGAEPGGAVDGRAHADRDRLRLGLRRHVHGVLHPVPGSVSRAAQRGGRPGAPARR